MCIRDRLLAALVFGSIREFPGATEGGVDGLAAVMAQLRLLRSDRPLRQLITTRVLLLSTALAPPFYVALSGCPLYTSPSPRDS